MYMTSIYITVDYFVSHAPVALYYKEKLSTILFIRETCIDVGENHNKYN